jgi:NADH-quinone oxidoreductase subunit L
MLLATLPCYPLLSFLLLILLGKRLSWRQASVLSVGALGLSALTSAMLIWQLLAQLNHDAHAAISVMLWTWFSLGNANIEFTLQLDALSAVMIAVVTGIGFLIHLYAAGYMRHDAHYSRFMAYMNLFIVAMLLLVLADNLVLLYLGWEGVGLCSFLLIGFWYQDQANVKAARKAFIVTRVGDTAMALGLFLLYDQLGQLNITELLHAAQQQWAIGSTPAFWGALLLLGGALGKSAQLPLQTWLPDAMAGPTPVSALIHAATMVTAGVYLIARMQGVFLLAPEVMQYVAWLGVLTLVIAGLAALAQTDIKRVLAYSTMSQIGYMMLALGAGAWSAGIFHLMTHAFFKALLFLTAGSVIMALHHQQNIFAMGGLWKKLPVETWFFGIGLFALVALPGSAGFFSKEAILAELWQSTTAGPVIWWLAIFGALLTSVYSLRLFMLTFMGQYRGQHEVQVNSSKVLRLPLVMLAMLAIVGGYWALNLDAFFNQSQLVTSQVSHSAPPIWTHYLALAIPFIGLCGAWFYFSHYRQNRAVLTPVSSALTHFAQHGLGFDSLYDWCIVRPYMVLAKVNRRDIIDQFIMLNAWYVNLWHEALIATQTGSLRWYVATLGIALSLLLGGALL